MKKLLAFIPVLLLVLVVAKVTADQFTMREKLASQISAFELTVATHERTRAPYTGELDKLIMARNAVLAHEQFLVFGTWDTSMGTSFALYLDASPLPQFVWFEIQRIMTSGATSVLDFALILLFVILPLILFFAAAFVSAAILREVVFGENR
jgi:hypothetical protein